MNEGKVCTMKIVFSLQVMKKIVSVGHMLSCIYVFQTDIP